MQNKKRLYKHLLIIYIIYFVVLIIAGASSLIPNFSRGWQTAQATVKTDQTQGNVRSYYVSAQLREAPADQISISGLPENVTPTINRLDLRVSVPESYTVGNAFKVIANSGTAYALTMLSKFLYLAILVLIALIINSLRKSIRNEQPLRHSTITRTRLIGALMLVAELGDALAKYIANTEAARLLEGTSLVIRNSFPLDYWTIIVAILFIFMAEVLSIGAQLSEEQKLTI